MDTLKIYASALADAFLSGDVDLDSLLSRGHRCLGHSPPWLEPLCKVIVKNNLAQQTELLIDYIYHYKSLRSAWLRNDFKHAIAYYYLPETKAKAPAYFVDQSVERLSTVAELCNFLDIDESHLLWLSDPWGSTQEHTQGPLQHYIYRWINKKSASGMRLLEIPKARLMSIQRKIHRDLLSKIPIHPSAHGFAQNRSIVSYTDAHLDKQWVLRLDIKHFFTSVSYARIYTIFSSLGYPRPVVRLLSLLCTNRAPSRVIGRKIDDWSVRKTLQAPHLPQGAPTSPPLSNLAAFNLDCRLTALASRINCNYSRYADDLLFSSNTYRNLNHLIAFIGSIVLDEGFVLNYRKTRVMGKGQRQTATGIVLNKHHNMPRKDYQQLKAILHNCLTKGVASQARGHSNYYAFLKGKISHLVALNPAKAEKLQKMFVQIDWTS